MVPTLPGAQEVSEIGFAATPSVSDDTEDDGLPNPAQWLAMLGEEGDEDTE